MLENSEPRCLWQSPDNPTCADVSTRSCRLVSSLHQQAESGGLARIKDGASLGRYRSVQGWKFFCDNTIKVASDLGCPFVNRIKDEISSATELKIKNFELY